jgi:dihydrodipicolinate synthase/N-acetylneuraminate lyase
MAGYLSDYRPASTIAPRLNGLAHILPSGLLAHYNTLAAAAELPIVLCNVPSVCAVDMLPVYFGAYVSMQPEENGRQRLK